MSRGSGRLANEFVTLVNPCAVKGISIFLALADAFPRDRLRRRAHLGHQRSRTAPRCAPAAERHPARSRWTISTCCCARTRVLLVPSLWAEARSRIVLEAMLRGVPVMAANVGGIPEAKMGVPYLLPVNPIAQYQTQLDEQMVPVAEVPPQDVGTVARKRSTVCSTMRRTIARSRAQSRAGGRSTTPRISAWSRSKNCCWRQPGGRQRLAPRRRSPQSCAFTRQAPPAGPPPAEARPGGRLVSRAPTKWQGLRVFLLPARRRRRCRVRRMARSVDLSRPPAGPRIALGRSALRAHGALDRRAR